jgi:hypothetical protein
MPALTAAEIRGLKDGDEVYAVILNTDDDGSRSIHFAGRTALEVQDYGHEFEVIPAGAPYLPFYLSSYYGDCFETDDWKCWFFRGAAEAKAKTEELVQEAQALVTKMQSFTFED